MKRRLAVLLALTLTFATLSPAGAIAAEAGDAQIIETVSVEEEAAVEEAEQEEAAPESEESAQEATTVSSAAEEETEEVVEETVAEEEKTEEQNEEKTEEQTEEAAAEGTTAGSTEIADEEEPVEATDAEEQEEGTTEEAAVVEEAIVEETAEEAKEATKTGATFKTVNGKRYFYINGVKKPNYGWYVHKNGTSYDTYYVGADSVVATGFKRIDGKTYYFWDKRCKTRAVQGKMMTGWNIIDGNKYYFNVADVTSRANGAMLTGWRKVNGKMYFFANSLYPSLPTGSMATGFKAIEGKKYYFGTDGVRRTGFQEIDGKKYYFVDKNYSAYTAAKEGMMLSYSKKIGNKYYYFSQYGYCRTGWVKVGKLLAYFNADGTAATGWKDRNGAWYYLKETGIAMTGWLKLGTNSIFYLKGANAGKMLDAPTVMSDGKLYFFDSEGRRATTQGWKGYAGYYYYTYANGTCAVNTTVDNIKLDENGRTTMTKMDMKAQDYYSNTNYLILVDKSTYCVCVYKGKKGNWVRVKGEWPCTHGGSLTPEGEKTIVGRLTKRSEVYGWADFEYSSAAFTMELSSGNFMHSVLFEKGTRGNPYDRWIMDPDMYRNYSKGCIRLQLPNAEWVWDNVPKGSKVVVYRSK